MKLYATVTSERATKAQGGNDFIETLLTVGSQENPQNVGNIRLVSNKDGTYTLNMAIYDEQTDKIILYRYEYGQIKGNKQKGETRKMCGKCATDPRWDMYDSCEHYQGE